ncbi:MAG: tRNA (adenosine(37)-N6)-threonylcarbamoyltransferase complex ATPase subunit type 1 TsaE [Coriobacteriia bacterium]|nr:tRNA (adenosine(37)-N6)-threonylcarbamoyltransferase complex ATPase subunit type 1 TsaE [Coriobacteriia bacterium]
MITTDSESGTQAAGRALGPLLVAGDVILLAGDLGAGKTALVKGIAVGLEVDGPVTSPTFNILLVHPGRLPLYHIDLYRLDLASQLEDIDYFGTLEAGGVTAVEWGDRFAEAAPADHVVLQLEIVDDDRRRIRIDHRGPRGAALAAAWLDACESLDDAQVCR